ncbi:MAG TPA: ABC transporter ATP-binding protein/permease, partial [Candidatus Competibacteraceae bacterium]|nr:ABC transporter ATP-binding protein/permease [Candidatus Competibacteraceae bacterium]
GSWLTHIIGRPLIRLNNDRQRFEANLRFNLIRVRENAESIALYDGAADERRALMQRFGDVWDNWLRLMKRQKRLGWFTIFYDYAASPFPLVMAAPQYFTGAIQLGQLMQIANAFGQVQGGLSWFVSAYTTLATWKATTDRILGFHHAVEQARAEGGAIELGRNGDESLQVEGLELALPDGKTLVSQAGFSVRPGERVLVTGPSGSGKSTLFRALAGIWPFGRGRVRLPASGRAFFLPQRPYLPIASLRAALCYPSPEGAFDDAAIREALELCRLSHLSGRLDEVRHWARELSPGEQQRLAVARALLQKPDWLFLDEATSALDEATERQLYQVLSERLPDTTVISIGHRPTLAAFHCRRLHIDGERLRELEPVPA